MVLKVGEVYEMPKDWVHRSRHVLRLKPGEEVIVFNGTGGEYVCELLDAPGELVVRRFDPINREPKCQVTLVVAISQGKKMDWIMQKATELGVSVIQPIVSERSKLNRPPSESVVQRWAKIIESACEQCGLNLLPTLKPCLAFDNWLEACDSELVFHLDPHGSLKRPSLLSGCKNAAVLIGCEGGWSKQESQRLEVCSQVQSWHLGERVLRMETAVLVVCGWLTIMNE